MIRDALSTRAFLRWYIIVSSVALGGLTAVVVALLIQYASVLGTQQTANITQCRLANVTRQQDIAIWDRLLNVPPAQAAKETPAQRAEVADLERLVAIKDTQRDCNAAFAARK